MPPGTSGDVSAADNSFGGIKAGGLLVNEPCLHELVERDEVQLGEGSMAKHVEAPGEECIPNWSIGTATGDNLQQAVCVDYYRVHRRLLVVGCTEM